MLVLVIVSLIIFICLLFIYSSCVISSYCSRLEEEDIKNKLKK